MKLKFNEFEIDILPFVQLCGMNCKKKEFIINSIEKHFSSGKYKDYEKEYQECCNKVMALARTLLEEENL